MKKINILLAGIFAGYLCIAVLANIIAAAEMPSQKNRLYRVSMNRLSGAIASYEQEYQDAPDSLGDILEREGISEYPEIKGLYVQRRDSGKEGDSAVSELDALLAEGDSDYELLVTPYACYKVVYTRTDGGNHRIYLLVNGILLAVGVFLFAVLFYVRSQILVPFHRLSELPYELSKGNLTVPLKENKNRYFGRFMWGMDLLREHLEENREREFALQKEKKLLLLSLSHDIKTPLNVIKLYAKAISKNLYKEEEKKTEIAENISTKVDEIEDFLSQIVTAAHEDFLHFDVENGEFYIRDVVENIREYYAEKMELNQIDFEIGEYRNCLLFGDKNRLEEVLQNVIENAIKYGDGKRICLSFEKSEEEFVISCRNSGEVLAGKEMPHIFDSFFRGSNVGKKQGSGLGLYICRTLMHQMEGEIYAQTAENEMIIKVVLHLA